MRYFIYLLVQDFRRWGKYVELTSKQIQGYDFLNKLKNWDQLTDSLWCPTNQNRNNGNKKTFIIIAYS